MNTLSPASSAEFGADRFVVVDSSVAFKWFVHHESATDRAWDLLEQHQRGEIVLAAPTHMPLEVLNAIMHTNADDELVGRVATDLDQFDIALFSLTPALLARSALVGRQDGLALYDAVFAALAETLRTELVTADRRQARASVCPVRAVF